MTRAILLAIVLPAALCVAAPNTLVDQAYGQMYNLQFDGAHRTLAQWEQQHPEDPMGPASDAAAWLYSEFARMHVLESEYFVENSSFFHMQKVAADPTAKQKFEGDLGQAKQLADAVLARSPDDPNALLASILCTGLRSDYLAMIDKKYLAALTEVKSGRAAAEKALAVHPDLYDAYLAIGTENYLLSQKAAPVRWLLHMSGAQTDKQVGLEKLRLTAEKGRYFAPYAKLLLAVADLRDNRVASARQRLAGLVAAFPQNGLYRSELAKL
jgi:hypothetical protein